MGAVVIETILIQRIIDDLKFCSKLKVQQQCVKEKVPEADKIPREGETGELSEKRDFRSGSMIVNESVLDL